VVSRDFTANTANYLDAGDATALDITTATFSVAAWVYPDDVSVERIICAKWFTGGGEAYILEIFTQKALVGTLGGGVETCTGATNVATGRWHHICGTRSATQLRIYLNGASDQTPSAIVGSLPNSTATFKIGKYDGGSPFDGRIGEVALWDVQLSDSEVAQLAAGVSPIGVQAAGLRGYWPLCGVASPEPDLKNGNQAVINGTVAAAVHPPGGFPCDSAGVGKAGWPRMIR
jgi:concanavalin A-like lectin/glucanase superfamily protein